jgi:predicted nucleotidyltransferase
MAKPVTINRQIIANGIGKILDTAAPHYAHAILFGSRARGDARQDSDWDVLILLDKDRITSADMDDISYPIRELGWDIDEIINPIMYTTKDWEAKSFTPFYKNVMKEGIAL